MQIKHLLVGGLFRAAQKEETKKGKERKEKEKTTKEKRIYKRKWKVPLNCDWIEKMTEIEDWCDSFCPINQRDQFNILANQPVWEN